MPVPRALHVILKIPPQWRRSALLPIAAGLLAMTGCQGMTVTGFRESAQVRVIHASPDAPPVDLYLGENALAYSLAFGTHTTYVPVGEGNYVLHADLAGTRQALGTATSALVAGRKYTAVVGDTLGSLRLMLVPDQSRAAPPGESALRVIDQAVQSGPFDVYLVPSGSSPGAASLLGGVSFGTVEGYRNVPAGAYSLMVLPAGAPGIASASLFTSPQMKLLSGSVKTVVLLDRSRAERQAGEGMVQAIMDDDGDLSGN